VNREEKKKDRSELVKYVTMEKKGREDESFLSFAFFRKILFLKIRVRKDEDPLCT